MLLNYLGKFDTPIYAGSVGPLRGIAREAESHGYTGMGTFRFPVTQSLIAPESAHDFLHRQLSNEKTSLICLGPLTNIAALLKSESAAPERIEQLIALGGAFSEEGNVSKYAEFNIFNDPDALRTVLQAKVPKIIIPAEVCRKVTISKAEIDEAVGSSPDSATLHSIVDVFIDYYMKDRAFGGFQGAVMYDLLCVAYHEDPSLFLSRPAFIEVDRSQSLTRGRTTMSAGPENAHVVYDVNAKELKGRFLSLLSRWTAGRLKG
jgi:inosine-uridine nucleoside N-ribohydrolase